MPVLADSCQSCGAENELRARFCAHCGARLYRRPRCSAGWFSLGGMAGLLIIVAALGFVALRRGARPEYLMKVGLELSDEKASAMFALLAPRSVPIIVGKSDKTVWIKGNSEQVDALRDFTGLVMRYDNLPHDHGSRIVSSHRPTWLSRETYRLPPELRDPLYQILAHDDVDVGVARTDSGISVNARPEDQHIIKRLIEVITD